MEQTLSRMTFSVAPYKSTTFERIAKRTLASTARLLPP